MILLDFNQTVIANIAIATRDADIQPDLIRHMILDTLRYVNVKFREDYGKLVICTDHKFNWRKEVFPFYKAARKDAREQSPLDWEMIYRTLDSIREEIKTFLPYKIIYIEGAEADDIIATLALKYQQQEPIMIVSTDKDFIQLHNDKVKQWNLSKDGPVEDASPKTYLQKHILKGDRGDGIPNVISPANAIVIGERQKPMTEKRIQEILESDVVENSAHPLYENYHRNKKLIDLTQIPEEIQSKIMNEFTSQVPPKRNSLLPYFSKFKLERHAQSLSEF